MIDSSGAQGTSIVDTTTHTGMSATVIAPTSSSVDPVQDAERDLLDNNTSSSRLWLALYSSGAAIVAALGYLLVESISYHNSTATADLTTIAGTITPIGAAIAFAWSSRPPGSSTK